MLMRRLKPIFISLLTVASVGVAISTPRLIAGLGDNKVTVHILIDDVDFGAFDRTDGIPSEAGNYGRNIVLERNFVTEPSLYLWARQAVTEHGKLRNISVIYKNSEGVEVDRLLLKGSHPISWTVEASDPSQGGYHEKVEVSVQGVAFE